VTITRLILAVLITIAVVVFAMANMHFVVLSLVFGPPLQMRLIFLLMSAFAAGIITASFVMMVRKIRLKRSVKREPVRREELAELE